MCRHIEDTVLVAKFGLLMKPLDGMQIVTLACNLPGPLAVAQLVEAGAAARKIEPLEGDALALAQPDWYQTIHRGVEVVQLNLKDIENRATLHGWLENADLFITATRPAALARLGIDWPGLHTRYLKLCQIAFIGYPPPNEELPGHDLNYQACAGLVTPPLLPATCIADLAGAQEAVIAAHSLLLARERGLGSGIEWVSLAKAAEFFAAPLRHGLTTSAGPLGGALAGYHIYKAKDGWIAVAALEPHFVQKLAQELSVQHLSVQVLEQAFLNQSAIAWESWGAQRGLPIVAVKEAAADRE